MDSGENEVVFSPIVRRCLEDAGWFPGRDIDVLPHVTALEAEGFVIYPVVCGFLRQFADLNIISKRAQLDLDAGACASQMHPENIARYAAFLGFLVCPIGDWSFIGCTLVMASNGQVYGGVGRALWFCGEFGERAIENMLGEKFGPNAIRQVLTPDTPDGEIQAHPSPLLGTGPGANALL